jgi:SRSO17 transposase
MIKLRWRIERDYEDLKEELWLDHFEGRSWPGFHHHGARCMATFSFIAAERARGFPLQSRLLAGAAPAPRIPTARIPGSVGSSVALMAGASARTRLPVSVL